MGRLVVAAIVLVLIGVAIWAALPSTPPTAAPKSLPPIAASPTVPQRRESARPPAGAPAAADGDLESKVTACLAAQEKVGAARAQRRGPAPAGQPSDAAVVSAACAPLYKEAACRDAMVRFDEPPPAERSRAVLSACAKAYCGELPAPKPAVCAHPDNVPEDQEQFIAWNELRQAILEHDLGAAAARRVLGSPPDRGR